MLKPNLQNSLFPTTKAEALKLANVTESIASQWHNQDYLSFDISQRIELLNSEVLELAFISKLFNSALSCIDPLNSWT